ncbi:MAG: PaaI family thioesterase [Burkholderiales bacterium]|nr:PaaI family thioesterase [Burkholderiales bacterium]
MNTATLQKTLGELAAEYVRRLNLKIESIEEDGVTLSMPVAPELVHGGGVLCGQAIMSAADTAMLVAMIARIGEFKPMTTVQMQTSFLRPIPKDAGSVTVVARLLRFGKTLSYGEVEFLTADRKLAAKATTTYALI